MIEYLSTDTITYPISTDTININYSQSQLSTYLVATCFAYGTLENNGNGYDITASFGSTPMVKIYQEKSASYLGAITACFVFYNLPPFEDRIPTQIVFNLGSIYTKAIATVVDISQAVKNLTTNFSFSAGAGSSISNTLNSSTDGLLIQSVGVYLSNGNFSYGPSQFVNNENNFDPTFRIAQSIKYVSENQTSNQMLTNFDFTNNFVGGTVFITEKQILLNRFKPLILGRNF